MKTKRIMLVAALVVGAGFRLHAQSFDDWRVRATRQLTGATSSQQLVLVHGLFSSSETWREMLYSMYQLGDTSMQIFTPDLYQDVPFSRNADSLVHFMDNKGIGPNAVLMGHSMGGIVSRLASRQRPVGVLVSIGTPHYGAPLANAVLGYPSPLIEFEYAFAGLYGDAVTAWPEDAVVDNSWISLARFEQASSNFWRTVGDMEFTMYAVVPRALGPFPAINDLMADSPAIQELNANAWREQSRRRISVAPSVGTGYLGGPFLMATFGNRQASDAEGQVMQSHGFDSFFSGLDLIYGANASDESFWRMFQSGLSESLMGLMQAFYWSFWNYSVVGGLPNDGLLPTSSMIMPSSTDSWYPGIPMIHTQETQLLADFMRNLLSEFFPH